MMGTYAANWEDEENNRLVKLAVEYCTSDDQIELSNVTPVSVTFFCAETNAPLRTIGVHTDNGRRVLMRQYGEKVGLENLQREVAEALLASAR